MKKGRLFESLVKIIEITLKDNPNTVILQNHKLTNKFGRKNEFDVVIIVNVNGYESHIVFECKDKSRPASGDEINSFKKKCENIPSIGRCIFVSKKGYQRGAIDSAKDYGMPLLQLKDIGKEKILDWVEQFKFSQVDLELLISDKIIAINKNSTYQISSYDFIKKENSDIPKIEIVEFIKRLIGGDVKHWVQQIWKKYNESLSEGVRPNSIELDFSQTFNKGVKIINCDSGEESPIDKFFFVIKASFYLTPSLPSESKEYLDFTSKKQKAEIVNYSEVFKGKLISVVRNPEEPNHINVFLTNQDGSPLHADEVPSIHIPKGRNGITIKKIEVPISKPNIK